MNGTHFAHPKCAIIAHQIDHLRKMLESYLREIEILTDKIPTACFQCVIGKIKKLEVSVKSKEFKLENFFQLHDLSNNKQGFRVVGNGSWKDP